MISAGFQVEMIRKYWSVKVKNILNNILCECCITRKAIGLS